MEWMSGQAVATSAITQMAEAYTMRFAEDIVRPRIVGREAEFPVVDSAGRAADVRRLWSSLLAAGDLTPSYDSGNQNLIVALHGEDYSYALEVGVGTVEVNTRPCTSLFEIEAIMKIAVDRLVRAALDRSWRLLGYGIQPYTLPSLRLLSPKQRYESLYRAMGAEWLWYTVTASDQVQIDVARGEIVELLNFGNLMAPVIIALCANSPVYGQQLSPFCSAREGKMAEIRASEFRHGMPAQPFSSIEEYISRLSQSTFLIVRDRGEVIPSSQSFIEYLQTHGADFDAFLFHEHYVWNPARLRVAYGTVELRPACQQPWFEQMAAAALGVGLIEEAARTQAYVEDALGPDYWAIMRHYFQRATRSGLAAAQPAPRFLRQIVQLAEDGLTRRGLGEETLLQPIWRRLMKGQNPAQHVRRIFQIDGIHRLLAATTIHPSTTRRLPS